MRRQDKAINMKKVNLLFEDRCLNEDIPTLRTLTYKSKLGFGKKKDLTIRMLLDLRKKMELVSAYYKLTSINFIPEILKDLGIVDELMINKPGSNIDMYQKYFEYYGMEKPIRSRDGINKLKRGYKQPTSSQLQSKNQGIY